MHSGPIALRDPAFDAVAALCRRFHVRQLDLFGSAVDGRFDPMHSDLDLLVEFEELPGGGVRGCLFLSARRPG